MLKILSVMDKKYVRIKSMISWLIHSVNQLYCLIIILNALTEPMNCYGTCPHIAPLTASCCTACPTTSSTLSHFFPVSFYHSHPAITSLSSPCSRNFSTFSACLLVQKSASLPYGTDYALWFPYRKCSWLGQERSQSGRVCLARHWTWW